MQYKILILIFSTFFLYSCNAGSAPSSADKSSLRASSVFKDTLQDCTAFGGVQARVRLSNQEANEGNLETVCGTQLDKPIRNEVENKKTSKKVSYELNVVDDSDEISKFCTLDENGVPYLGIYVTGALVDNKGKPITDVNKLFHKNVICITGPKAGDSSDNETDGPVIPPDIDDNKTDIDPDEPEDIEYDNSGNVIIEATPVLDSLSYTNITTYTGIYNTKAVYLRNIGQKSLYVENVAPTIGRINQGNKAFQFRDASKCIGAEIKGGEYCYIIINFNPKLSDNLDSLYTDLTIKFKDGTSIKSELHATKNIDGYYKSVSTNVETPTYSLGDKKGSVARIINDIHIFGGTAANGDFRDDHYAFDTVLKTWKKIDATGEKPSARHSHAAAVVGYNMYIFGGIDKDNLAGLKDFYVYRADKKEWKKLPSPPILNERYGMTLTAMGTRLYLFGGFKNGGVSEVDNALYMYDTKTAEWSNLGLTPMSKRGYHQATRDMNLNSQAIYFYGGTTLELPAPTADKKIYTYDIERDMWQSTVPKNSAVFSPVVSDFYMLPLGDFIIVTAGKNNTGSTSSSVYSFERNPIAGTIWSETVWKGGLALSSLDFTRAYAISVDGAGYIFKFGATEGTPAEVYSYHHKLVK